MDLVACVTFWRRIRLVSRSSPNFGIGRHVDRDPFLGAFTSPNELFQGKGEKSWQHVVKDSA